MRPVARNGRRAGHRPGAAFTLIEVLVVIAIIATLAGLVVALVPRALFQRDVVLCTARQRDLVGLLTDTSTGRLPHLGGPTLILTLVQRGDLAGRDALEGLFCPGDTLEDLRAVGGEAAYDKLDPAQSGDYRAFTSYAARDLTDPANRFNRGSKAVVLTCDDSEDHHDRRGVVVGMSNGVAKWRDKLDDYELTRASELAIGPDSAAEELRCLRAD